MNFRYRITSTLAAAGLLAALAAPPVLAKPGPPGMTGQGRITLGIGNMSWCLSVKSVKENSRVYLLPCGGKADHEWWLVSRQQSFAMVQIAADRSLCLGQGDSDVNARIVRCDGINQHGFPLVLGPGGGKNVFQLAYRATGARLAVSDPAKRSRTDRLVHWAVQPRTGFIQSWRLPVLHRQL